MGVVCRLLTVLIFLFCFFTIMIPPDRADADSAIMPSCSELPAMGDDIAGFRQQFEKKSPIDPAEIDIGRFFQLVASLTNMAEASYDYELGRAVAALESFSRTGDWEQARDTLEQVADLFARGVKRECGGSG